MSAPAHEHFCVYCYPYGKTNGSAKGWWRCLDRRCTKKPSARCRKHRDKPPSRHE